MATNRSTVVGVFERHEDAERAVDELKRVGFRDDQIGMAVRNGENTGTMAEDRGTHAGGGAVSGAVIGGILGAAAALLIPGIGPVLAIGTLGGTVLAGAAVGAGIGALAGALIGMGVPEEEAKYYQGEFERGRTIVTVNAGARYQEADDILHRFGAYDVEHKGSMGTTTRDEMAFENRPAAAGQARMNESSDAVRLREEQLRVEKERVQTGEVRVGKEVVEEQKTMEVPVTREEVVIERRPVNQPSDKPVTDDSRTISVPVHEERVNVEKQPVVTEEVGVKKVVHQDTQHVSETVRREKPVIEGVGATKGQSYRWEDEMPYFRQHWQSNYGGQGGRWDEYEPYYRYGFDRWNEGRWMNRNWSQVEPEFRKDWESRNPGKSWDVASNPIKHAWDHLSSTPHTHTS